jgi:hypothetical protein
MRRLALVFAVVLAGSARADNLRFDAQVARGSITLDQTVELDVTLERDGSQVFESYRAPDFADFDLLHTSTSEQMQMSIAGGRQNLRMVETHHYVLRAKKRGSFTIGPASVKVGGQTLKTKPITIQVAPPSKNAVSRFDPTGQPTPGAPIPSAPPPSDEAVRDDVFLDASFGKKKVYVGEQVLATWTLYAASDVLRYRPTSEPKHEDFWAEDVFTAGSNVGWDRQIVNGRAYAATVVLKRALFPLKAGKLGVTALEGEITTRESIFVPNASVVRRAPALTLEVLPLPGAGRPSGFEAANVGQFELRSTVDRSQVKGDEALTWKLTLRGTGNLRNVRLPKLDQIDGFKVYEPTVKETLERGEPVRGDKVYTYLLVPTRGGELRLPAMRFPYFDPETRKYAEAKSEPITIQVTSEPSAGKGEPAASPTDNVLAQQIRPIRNRAKVRAAIGPRLFRGRGGLALFFAPPLVWLIVVAGDTLSRRLGQDSARARRRRARRQARRRGRAAEYHIKMQRPSAFFGECARILYEHLEYRLGAKVEGLTLTELRPHLIAHGFAPEAAEAVVMELENCDFARFAPSASGPGEMRAALRRVKNLLGLIERVRPPGEAA